MGLGGGGFYYGLDCRGCGQVGACAAKSSRQREGGWDRRTYHVRQKLGPRLGQKGTWATKTVESGDKRGCARADSVIAAVLLDLLA